MTQREQSLAGGSSPPYVVKDIRRCMALSIYGTGPRRRSARCICRSSAIAAGARFRQIVHIAQDRGKPASPGSGGGGGKGNKPGDGITDEWFKKVCQKRRQTVATDSAPRRGKLFPNATRFSNTRMRSGGMRGAWSFKLLREAGCRDLCILQYTRHLGDRAAVFQFPVGRPQILKRVEFCGPVSVLANK